MTILKILKLRDELFNHLSNFITVELVKEDLQNFINSLQNILKYQVKRDILINSTTDVVGIKLNKKDLYKLCWRLASNIESLKLNKPAGPWYPSNDTELCTIQFLTYDSWYSTRKKTEYSKYIVQFLSGTACPLTTEISWPNKLIGFLARKEFGFTKVKGKYPFKNPAELVNLRCLATLDSKYSKDNKPGFFTITKSSACLCHNKKILDLRMRISRPCPGNYTFPCFSCPIGYNKCPAGTHKFTYEYKECRKCKNQEWHDPSNTFGICNKCRKDHPC